MIGARLGVYEVLAHLGEGGMGAVYRARDTRLKRDVAIKVLLPDVANDPERLARFQREAELLAALNHPNIAHLYGLEGVEGQVGQVGLSGPFLVMELVEGPTLADVIAEAGSRPAPKPGAGSPKPQSGLALAEALAIARQVADALEAAHDAGIIHRDLKPANIKVRDDGTVKVLDFGLAKAVDPAGGAGRAGEAGRAGGTETVQPASPARPALTSPTLTSPVGMTGVGVLLGTAAYMSPEQGKGRPADKRADIWAFGCVLFEMLTGHRAFEGEEVTDLLVAVLGKEPDWSLLPSTTPPALRTLLQRCLAKDRKRRLDSAAVARLEVEDIIAAPAPEASPAPARAFLRPAPLALAFVAGAALTVVIGAWSVRRLTPPTPPQQARAVTLDIGVPPGLAFGPSPDAPSPIMTPDGRCIIFAAARVDGTLSGIYKRCLDDTEAHLMPGTSTTTGREGPGFPFLSADGRWMAFSVGQRLFKTPVQGGPVEPIGDGFVDGSRGTWNTAGEIIVPSTLYDPSVSSRRQAGLVRLSASGGLLSPVTRIDESAHETQHRAPRFLPDGRHFLYLAAPENRLKIGSLDETDATDLGISGIASPTYVPQGFVLYVSQQNLIARPIDLSRLAFTGEPVVLASPVRADAVRGRAAFGVSDEGTLVYRRDLGRTVEVAWVDRSGEALSHPVPDGNYRGAEPSPDGARVALRRRDEVTGGTLWLLDATRGTDARIEDGPSALAPRWSPDGRTLVFNPGGDRLGLYVRNVESPRKAERLLGSDTAIAATDWTPDGRHVLYERQESSTGVDVWALPMSGDTREPTPVLRTRANEGQAVLSADGKWIAYTSDESGRLEVYVQAFPVAGERWQVSTRGGRQPRWRGDGRELFFLDLSSVVMSVAAQPQATRVELGTPRRLFPIRGNASPDLNPAVESAAFAVSADGQRFLVSNLSLTADSEPLTVVLNWPALLAAKAGSK